MRKTKYLMVTLESGILFDIDEAIKTANAIKIFLSRLAEKNGYYLNAVIGISENNVHSGEFVYKKNGKRGRPKKIFKYKNEYDTKQPNLHIHIFLHANPADMIANRLMTYLNKKNQKFLVDGKKTICRKTNCIKYKDYEYEYVTNQSCIIRKVEIGQEPEIEECIDLSEESEGSQDNNENCSRGFIFTNLKSKRSLIIQGKMGEKRFFENGKKLGCNIPIYISIENRYLYKRKHYRYLIIDIEPP